MRKLLPLALVFLAAAFVLSNLRYLSNLSDLSQKGAESSVSKKPILKAALVADSHNENELLEDALRQAQGKGINFVIGLGDYTNLGTIGELRQAREVFDNSKLEYYLTAGDRDGWESRQKGTENFLQVFGNATQVFERERVRFVLLDNSDIYSGISEEDWGILTSDLSDLSQKRLRFVFAHKTPFHPQSKHIMGEDNAEVSKQAKEFLNLMESETHPCHSGDERSEDSRIDSGQARMTETLCPNVDGFFPGDLHFFAQYKSPSGSVKITTVGAVARERNFQGPRFAILTVYEDYSWEVEDIEIR